MTSSPHHWFVQTDFGALLGPMPDETLAEMARTGALLFRDRVRQGTDGEWRPASEVPGLFDEMTPQLGLMSSQLEDLFAPQDAPSRESAATKRSIRRDESKTTEGPAAPPPNEFEFEIDTPLIAPPPLVVDTESGPRVDRVNVAASHPRGRGKGDDSKSVAPTVAPPSEPARVDASVSILPQPNISESEPVHSSPAGWQARASSSPRWQPTKKRITRWPNFDKQTWLMGAISGGVFFAFLAAWWLWPRQRPDVYANYVAIYKELQQRRADSKDQAGWSEFSTRAKSQLDATLPWLEQRAKPGDREKSLLLYAGRDLQDLLEHPRDSSSPHEKRLTVFFDQLQEIYGTK